VVFEAKAITPDLVETEVKVTFLCPRALENEDEVSPRELIPAMKISLPDSERRW